MGEFLADFTSAERLYVICALVGGVLFRMNPMNLISGFGHDAGFDMDAIMEISQRIIHQMYLVKPIPVFVPVNTRYHGLL